MSPVNLFGFILMVARWLPHLQESHLHQQSPKYTGNRGVRGKAIFLSASVFCLSEKPPENFPFIGQNHMSDPRPRLS